MPADKYKWDWGQATFLNSLIHLYNSKSLSEKSIYLNYVKVAMDATYNVANGKHPNAVASAHGMAFLARITRDQKYIDKCNEIYADYLKTPRAPNGGVSHRAETNELWDDTVYMLSMYLLEMYRLTNDEKYIAEFLLQFKAHNEKLTDKETGLWVHGWDADNEDYNDGCSNLGWADKVTRRSSQIWARGNGWIGMALADALLTVSKTSSYRKPLEKALKNYISYVAPLQHKETGYWYQLMTLPNDPKNFDESSSTAMFSYAITIGLKLKLIPASVYDPIIDRAYDALKTTGVKSMGEGYLIPVKVSGGTCVGSKEYYLTRKITEGTGFGYGSFIMFGLAYEQYKGIRK
jgi:unsaturated rhamnogalacturonyl hydrolase